MVVLILLNSALPSPIGSHKRMTRSLDRDCTMGSTTEELNKIGKLLLNVHFKGIYALDKLPARGYKNVMFIANTDTSNLPGEHWIAIVVRNNQPYCFDPLGMHPPLSVINWLNRHYDTWSCNMRRVQPIFSTLCGYFCIHFLYATTRNYLQNETYDEIIDLLYPIAFTPATYEETVIDFIKHYVMK